MTIGWPTRSAVDSVSPGSVRTSTGASCLPVTAALVFSDAWSRGFEPSMVTDVVGLPVSSDRSVLAV